MFDIILTIIIEERQEVNGFLMELKGRCVQIESRDIRTGVAVIIIFDFSRGCPVRAVGAVKQPEKNMEYCLTGDYISDGSFRFHAIRRMALCRQDSVLILSNTVAGISERLAGLIVKELGDDIFEYPQIDGIEEKLCLVPGIGSQKAEAVLSFLKEGTDENGTISFLSQYDVPYTSILRILDSLGGNAVPMVKKNPYLLMDYDVSFEICDKIAMKSQTDPWSMNRIEALVRHSLKYMMHSGDTRMELNKFTEYVTGFMRRSGKSTLMIPWSLIELTLYSNKYAVVYADGGSHYIAAKHLYHHEKAIVKNLQRIKTAGYGWIGSVSSYISQIEQEEGVCYNTEQRSAFDIFSKGGILLLAGGPGTGKTTTISGLVHMAINQFPGKRILLCAPTGRAAVRMSEISREGANTIHKALGINWYKNESKSDILEYDIIIIDEMSMCDTETFSLLLHAVASGTILVLAGDYHQLPSVGPGQIFKDLVLSNVFTCCHLTRILRQKEGCVIIDNTLRVLEGLPLLEGEDFKINYLENDEAIFSKIEELSIEALPQVLCPMKKQLAGVISLNAAIQAKHQRSGRFLYLDGTRFYTDDRIIMNRNNYASGYMNGDVGQIKEVGENCLRIEFADRILTLELSQTGGMDLAYVLTVHKAQGAECDRVLLILPESAKSMASREILYTAISRARASVEIMAAYGVLEAYLAAADKNKRNCGLLSDLIAAFKK